MDILATMKNGCFIAKHLQKTAYHYYEELARISFFINRKMKGSMQIILFCQKVSFMNSGVCRVFFGDTEFRSCNDLVL